jgi:hypothetical protein
VTGHRDGYFVFSAANSFLGCSAGPRTVLVLELIVRNPEPVSVRYRDSTVNVSSIKVRLFY